MPYEPPILYVAESVAEPTTIGLDVLATGAVREFIAEPNREAAVQLRLGPGGLSTALRVAPVVAYLAPLLGATMMMWMAYGFWDPAAAPLPERRSLALAVLNAAVVLWRFG
jgi:hypothetical protein